MYFFVLGLRLIHVDKRGRQVDALDGWGQVHWTLFGDVNFKRQFVNTANRITQLHNAMSCFLIEISSKLDLV